MRASQDDSSGRRMRVSRKRDFLQREVIGKKRTPAQRAESLEKLGNVIKVLSARNK